MGDNGEEPLQLHCLSINTRCSSWLWERHSGGNVQNVERHSGGNVQNVRAFGWECSACRTLVRGSLV